MTRSPLVSLSPKETTTELLDLVAELGHVERQILLGIARRLRDGQSQYGTLDLSTDRRDWRKEEHAEMVDGAVYRTIELLRRGAI